MSPLAQRQLDVLASAVRDDLAAIADLQTKISQARTPSEPEPLTVMALAALLHHLYTAIETALERIATVVDGVRPTGDRSHQDLLTQLSLAIAGVRDEVLSPATALELGRFLRFQHFFRHAYRIDFLWAELAGENSVMKSVPICN